MIVHIVSDSLVKYAEDPFALKADVIGVSELVIRNSAFLERHAL